MACATRGRPRVPPETRDMLEGPDPVLAADAEERAGTEGLPVSFSVQMLNAFEDGIEGAGPILSGAWEEALF
jgi:hypothetical protein